MNAHMQIESETYDGESLSCRAKWEICYGCEGRGVKDSTEFASDLSPDHMPVTRDVLCEECNGSGTVLVPDPEDPNSVAVIEFLNQQRKDELGLRAGIDAA